MPLLSSHSLPPPVVSPLLTRTVWAMMEIQYSSIQSIITHIVRDPNAQEKSIEQMDTIMAILNQDPRDMTVVMNTREGKSLLWTMPLLLGLKVIYVVICPFKSLVLVMHTRWYLLLQLCMWH